MKFRNVLLYNRYTNILIQETKRYAGHSKWQNIKATKQEHDTARAQIFNTLSHKMKAVAIGMFLTFEKSTLKNFFTYLVKVLSEYL